MLKKTVQMSITSILAFLLMLISSVHVFCSPLESLVLKETVEVPIIMYHNISKDKGSLNKFVISPDAFEEDLKLLKEYGYETIFMSELIDFVHNGKVLPDKPVIITFDDGSFSIDKYAFPLLEKYDMKAVVSIIGKVTDEYSSDEKINSGYYPNLTWSQINHLVDSGRFEVQNHSYDLHKGSGAKKFNGESVESYESRLTGDVNRLQERITDMTNGKPTTFTYPFGAISESSDDIIKNMGFSASLSCFEKVNKVTIGDMDCLYSLGRFVRPHDILSTELISKFEYK